MTVADPTPSGAGRATDGSPALVLRGLRKRYGDLAAVDGVDLDVARGEFLTLLGPSGSGKTTTLRMIAGFVRVDEGSIEIGGEEMRAVPPHRRDVGMVFQNYALFPHMTAAQNVAFPLEMRGVPRSERRDRVAEALELVRLERFAERYPRQLSGGQQQRVALARAVVFRPRLLLMDEPLGALDKKLREALQLEILRISRQLGATVVYVTHDQEEALVMSDRIAIFDRGRIQQLGTGEDLYERPASVFVADFVGESNLLAGRLERDGDGWALARGGDRWPLGPAVTAVGLGDGDAATLVLRPEHLRVVAADAPVDGANRVAARVTEVLYLGPTRKVELVLDDGRPAVVRETAGTGADWRTGDAVALAWPRDKGVVVPSALDGVRAVQRAEDASAVDPLDVAPGAAG